MKTRRIIAFILMILVLPLLVLGLIDPLEGGIALIAAMVIYVVAFVLAGHRPPGMLWIPFVVAIVVGALTLWFAIANLEFTSTPEPLNLPVRIGIWVYRAAVALTLVGGIRVAWRMGTALRSGS